MTGGTKYRTQNDELKEGYCIRVVSRRVQELINKPSQEMQCRLKETLLCRENESCDRKMNLISISVEYIGEC